MKIYTKQLNDKAELRYHYSRKQKGWVMEIFIGDKCIKSSIQQTLMKDYYIEEVAERDLKSFYYERDLKAFNEKWYDTDRPECMKEYAALWDSDTSEYRAMQYNGKGQYNYVDNPSRCWLVSDMKKVLQRFTFADTMEAAIEERKSKRELAIFHREHPENNPNAACHCPNCGHPLNVDPYSYEGVTYYEGGEGDEIVGLKDNIHITCKCGHEVNIKPKIIYEIS